MDSPPPLMPVMFYPPPVPHMYPYCVYPEPTFFYSYHPSPPVSSSPHLNSTTQTCYSCGMFGHTSRECMNNGQICYHCGDVGHVSKECAVSQDEKVCYRCKSPGHKAVKCDTSTSLTTVEATTTAKAAKNKKKPSGGEKSTK